MRNDRGGILLLFLLTLLSGCANVDGPAATRTPVVLSTSAPDGGTEDTDPAVNVQEATAPIEALISERRHREALDVIAAMESSELSAPLEARLLALRLRIKQRLIQTSYLDARIVLDAHRISLGTPITGEIVLRNLSEAELVIPRSARGATDTTLMIQAQYVEYDPDGTVIRENRQTPRTIGEEIRLMPGDSQTWPLVIDSLELGGGSINYRTYSLEATLYPSTILIGGEDYPGNVTFEPDRCDVFPRNWEHLAAQPVARLREALSKNSPPHLCLAAALVPKDSRRRAVGQLLDALAEHGEAAPRGDTRQACCVALRILTGEEEPTEPDAWLTWGREGGYVAGTPR